MIQPRKRRSAIELKVAAVVIVLTATRLRKICYRIESEWGITRDPPEKRGEDLL